jgi:mono/diheme cytochrome c family protein
VLVVRCFCLGSLLLAGLASAETPGVDNPDRAQVNYMLNCQGCHGAEGAAAAGGVVPAMKDFVGNFLSVEDGREFLVRVPGSANAPLNDAELAEVLNWMLPRLSPQQMPEDFEPYTQAEVAELRQHPLANVISERAKLVARMALDGSNE